MARVRKLSCEDFHRKVRETATSLSRLQEAIGNPRQKSAWPRFAATLENRIEEDSIPARRTTSKLACGQKAVSGWYATSAVTEARQDCVSARRSDVSRRNATQSQVPSAGVTPLRGSPPGTSQRVKPCTLLRISSSTYSTKTLGRARISEHDRHALGVARPGDRGSDHVPGVAWPRLHSADAHSASRNLNRRVTSM